MLLMIGVININQEFIEVLMSKIESKLTLFEMQIEDRFVHATKPGQSSFGESRKAINSRHPHLFRQDFSILA